MKPREIYANSLTLEGGKAIVNFMLRALVWALASRFALAFRRARTNKVILLTSHAALSGRFGPVFGPAYDPA